MNSKLIVCFLLLVAMVQVGCDQDNECSEGHLCVSGNVLEYQSSNDRAKLIIDNPEGAAYTNEAVTVTDLVPAPPAVINLQRGDLHFGGGWFKIEPTDMQFKKLITISIQFPQSAKVDALGNNWADDYILYYVDHDNWKPVNDSEVVLNDNMVSGQVRRLGEYAVAAPKECIVGDWRIWGDNSYGYAARVVFLNSNSGWREYIVDCDTAIAVFDYQPTKEIFSWELNNDTLLSMYNFAPINICGGTGFAAPDNNDIIARCEDLFLVLENFNFYGGDSYVRYD